MVSSVCRLSESLNICMIFSRNCRYTPFRPSSIWGALFFRESVTPGKVIGAAVVVVGVVLFALSDGKDEAAGDAAKDAAKDAAEAASEEGEGAPE